MMQSFVREWGWKIREWAQGLYEVDEFKNMEIRRGNEGLMSRTISIWVAFLRGFFYTPTKIRQEYGEGRCKINLPMLLK